MINSVRNTVLSVLNKNNYGYLSPSDFNLFAKQAQLDLFQDYFYQYNYQVMKENTRQSGTGYADIKKGLEEVIDLFSVTNDLTHIADNRFSAPSITTTGDDYYLILKVLCYDASVPPRVFKGEAEKVHQSKITMLNNSMLTAPSELFPAYTLDGDTITVLPSTFDAPTEVECNYIRYPKDPKWTYVSLTNGEPTFDQSAADFQDFELSIEDEVTLVLKILQYAGVSIREAEVYGFANSEETQDIAEEK
ncbi:MAG: hypothetical protein JSW41_05290 [Candidatus Aenigmatarchaeota archaeon]|nr:MAG: hypothetical protein JSW41_05290 [Candidatus Aenigmarchaeota archaeon]